jgi:hypothetical protein
MEVLGPIVLGAVLAYAIIHNRGRTRAERARTDAATRQLYDQEEKARRGREEAWRKRQLSPYGNHWGKLTEGLGGRRRPMTLPSALLENSEWMVVAIAAAVLMIVGFVSLAVFSRKVSRLAKQVEKLALEVNELRSLEERRILKDLRSQHSPGEKIQAPPLAHF